ncbi:histidine-type phosphatase [Rhizomicrobium palustre]
MVIVERHGVRPPTKAPEAIAKFAEQPWPQWSVKPGELTAHGAEAIALMGAALKRVYMEKGLLAATPCPKNVFVWSDSADQRTRASGDAVLKGFGCEAQSHHLEPGIDDPLFDPIAAGICPVDPEKGKAALQARLPIILDKPGVRASYLKARATMQAILTPNGCGKEGQRACLISEGEDKVVIRKGEVRLDGPLDNASGLTENLLLEYSEGKPLSVVGWGRAGDKLSEVLTLHNLYADIFRSAPYMASRRGSLLAQQVVDILEGQPSHFKGAAPVPMDAKLVLFLGHDTNLSNMAGFLNATWSLAGQPDDTAPNTAIAFERWRRADGSAVVRVNVFFQSLDETRKLTPIKTPRVLELCGREGCPLTEITQKISANVSQDCLH